MKFLHELGCLELETRLLSTHGIQPIHIYPADSGQQLTWDGRFEMVQGIPVIIVRDNLVGDGFTFHLADLTSFEVEVFGKMLYNPPVPVISAEDCGAGIFKNAYLVEPNSNRLFEPEFKFIYA